MEFENYRLPDGQIVRVDATASKGQPVIGFTLKGGEIVDAVLVNAQGDRKMKKLGTNQAGALRALRQHGYWYGDGFGCGWNWTSQSETRAIMESLVKRGLVIKAEEEVGGRMRNVYRPATNPASDRLALLEQQARELMKAVGDFSGEHDSARVGMALGFISKAVEELTQARMVATAQDQREYLRS